MKKFLLFISYFLLLTVFSGCSDDPALPLYDKAEELFSKGAYSKAIETYTNIVNKYPESSYAPASQYKIGLINHLYLKNIQKAMNAYATLMLLYPDSKEVIMARQDRADIYIALGDYRKAIGEYQWLMKNSGGRERDNFQYQMAMVYLKLNDIKQARIELHEIIKNPLDSPLAPQVYYQIANTHYLEGDYQEAIKAYEKTASLYPKSPYASEAMLGKIICIEEEGNLTEAVRLYIELEKSYPNPEIIKMRIAGIETREKKNALLGAKEN